MHIPILSRIPAHYPMAWVVGIMLWCGMALLMAIAVLCIWLGWHVAYFIVFFIMFLLTLGGFGCGLWFMVERISGRITPWREPPPNYAIKGTSE